VLEDAGRTDEAVQSLERAAQADATYPEPHYALSRLYRRLGRADRAESELRLFQQLKAPPNRPPDSAKGRERP
jgi:Flp pilus assembly protein TadD